MLCLSRVNAHIPVGIGATGIRSAFLAFLWFASPFSISYTSPSPDAEAMTL
jgi:hypothetical protein